MSLACNWHQPRRVSLRTTALLWDVNLDIKGTKGPLFDARGRSHSASAFHPLARSVRTPLLIVCCSAAPITLRCLEFATLCCQISVWSIHAVSLLPTVSICPQPSPRRLSAAWFILRCASAVCQTHRKMALNTGFSFVTPLLGDQVLTLPRVFDPDNCHLSPAFLSSLKFLRCLRVSAPSFNPPK
jgi:hypothetical protein